MVIKSYGLKGIIKSERINKKLVIVIRDQRKQIGEKLHTAMIRMQDSFLFVKYKVIVLMKTENSVCKSCEYNIVRSYNVSSKLEALYHFNRIKKNYE